MTHLVKTEAGFILVLVNRVIDGLETLGCLKMVLLMDVVSDGKFVVADLEMLDSLVVQVSSLDLFQNDHSSNEVFEVEDQSELVKNVVEFVFFLHGAVGFDLHVQDNVGGFLLLAVFFVHLGKEAGAVGVFDFYEEFSFCGFSNSLNQIHFVQSCGHFVNKAHNQLNHLSYGLLSLPSLLDYQKHKLIESPKLPIIKRQLHYSLANL